MCVGGWGVGAGGRYQVVLGGLIPALNLHVLDRQHANLA